jgi:hypothetical protein
VYHWGDSGKEKKRKKKQKITDFSCDGIFNGKNKIKHHFQRISELDFSVEPTSAQRSDNDFAFIDVGQR